MTNIYLANAFRLLFLVLIQLLILNELELHGFIRPFIYPLFILLLPVKTPTWLLMLIGFGVGLLVDIYDNTVGFHAAACVLMAYCRPFLFSLNTPRDGYDNITSPVLHVMGLPWTLLFLGLSVVLHHFLLFFIEAGSLDTFIQTLSKIGLNTAFSLGLMLLYQFVTRPKV